MNERLDLSIVIVSWNVKKLLKQCLESILKAQGDLNLEVFVVDNASSDGSVEEIRNHPYTPSLDRLGTGSLKGGDIKVIENKKNLGFAKANNQAIQKARGEFILLLNPDTKIKNNALEKMVAFMREHKECGVAGCKLSNPDGSFQPSVRRFPTFWSQVMILLKLHHLFPNARVVRKYFAKDFDYSVIGQGTNSQPHYPCYPCVEVDQVMGAFFMIRKEVVQKIGMLDENFYIWFEEVDFCKRVKNAGWKVYYIPVVGIVHYGAQSFNQVLSLKKQRIFNRSLLYYFRKHHSLIEWLGLWLFQLVSLGLAALVSLIKLKKNKQVKKTQSAGGVVVNKRHQIIIVNQNGTSWSLPKGHLEVDEDKLTAAKREICEETGITNLKLIKTFDKYKRHRIDEEGREDKNELKTIYMFLFHTDQEILKPQDPKNPEARWIPKERVVDLLTHPKDREFFLAVIDKI